jgi:N-acetylglucosaminyldiphosphoundecaprenol N-acetyl-beta-D-mannosaminyltransferase
MLELKSSIPVRYVLGFAIAALPFHQQLKLLLGWARTGCNKMICIANTHMLIEAQLIS